MGIAADTLVARPPLRSLVEDKLTSVARPERTLQAAANDFHAACDREISPG